VTSPPATPTRTSRIFRGITRPVWLLGLVSFFADLSSELVYPIIPIFVTTTLGAPAVAVGIIEGFAEGTANITKLVSGRWSDRIGARKPLITAGYALAAAGKAIIAVAPVWPVALLGRATDRFGKGVRSAPRDALLGDLAEPQYRGRVFGFHRSMDTGGAILGPLVGLLFLTLWGEHLRLAIAIAVIPGVVAVFILRWLPEHAPPKAAATAEGASPRVPLPRGFYLFLGATLIFMLGNSSDAFLILRSKDLGLSTALVVLAYVAYNVVYAALAFPAGAISDRIPRVLLLVGGYVVFGVVYAGFAFAGSSAAVWPLFICYGAYIALTDGITKAMVVDLVPGDGKSTALGLFQGVAGLGALVASVTAGVLWDQVGPGAPFWLGAACAAAAAVATLAAWRAGALRGPTG
jgi:MFS family permease